LVRSNPDEQHLTAATPDAGPCSEVCSGGGYGYARQSFSSPNETGATLPHDSRLRPVAISSAHTTASTPATIVRVVAPDGSFDWGDAGIGAGASLVLLGIGLAGTRAVTTSRKRHTREQRAIATN
jgi:hypothetical protein